MAKVVEGHCSMSFLTLNTMQFLSTFKKQMKRRKRVVFSQFFPAFVDKKIISQVCLVSQIGLQNLDWSNLIEPLSSVELESNPSEFLKNKFILHERFVLRITLILLTYLITIFPKLNQL